MVIYLWKWLLHIVIGNLGDNYQWLNFCETWGALITQLLVHVPEMPHNHQLAHQKNSKMS